MDKDFLEGLHIMATHLAAMDADLIAVGKDKPITSPYAVELKVRLEGQDTGSFLNEDDFWIYYTEAELEARKPA